MLGDLETNVMFAQAGTLNPDNEGETFGDHRESILKTAKNLVEDTKNLVVSAQGSQEQLATSTQSVLSSMDKLLNNVKFGAMALGSEDSEAQVGKCCCCAWFILKSKMADIVDCLKVCVMRFPKD